MSNKYLKFSGSLAAGLKKSARISEGILNGVIGDHLSKTTNPLAREMQWYHQGQPLEINSANLSLYFSKITPKICIFIHGLMNDETHWNFKDNGASNYGSLLQYEMGYTPFYIRYNTGLHISENGKIFSHQIQELLNAYPIEPKDIVIIAHSMGGLVTRSACHYATLLNHDWTEKTTKIFFLGTPHLGAPLEKFGNVVSYLLNKIPISYTNLSGQIINLRSAGIKDLRFGYLTDEDWNEKNPDELLHNNKTTVPLL